MTYHGKVIHGLQNGRKFGFPTANILLIPPAAISTGVYAVKVYINSNTYGGMLYVGNRPTLNLDQISVEINIFNFNLDIYDQNISFYIIHKIREEKRFSSIEQLIEQIKNDREKAIYYVS